MAPSIAPRTRARSARPSAAGLGGLGALAMQGTPSIRLPGEHFAAALFFLLTGAIGLAWVAPELAGGLYLAPHVSGVTHCFTLGWLSMTIFGALYQLLPVALGVPVTSERAGHFAFWLFAPGVALFAPGIAFGYAAMRYTGVTMIASAIACIIVNVGLALRRVASRDVIWSAIVLALAFLTATLALGATLAANLEAGFLGEWRVRALATHLHVALLGWVLMMIFGISHRLLPMFLLAHTATTQWTRRALICLAAGVLLLATGMIAPDSAVRESLEWIGLTLAEAGLVCFVWQVRCFFSARKRPRLDAGLRHVVVALAFLGMAAVVAPLALALGSAHRTLDTAYIMLGVPGGLTLYVVGQFYKIVPFLAWMSRFRDDMGRKQVPTVAQLYSPAVAHAGLALFLAGTIGMIAGVASGVVIVVRTGACMYLLATLLFISQAVRVAFGTSFSVAPATRAVPALAKVEA